MNKVDEIFRELFKISQERIYDDATMNDIPGWDSLTHMDLIAAIEEEFAIELDGDEIAEMTSIENVRKIIVSKNADRQ
tara:strand:+ start:175 stop:408 length:234 start_codon:yes stop_codon:yes gene_type:complete